MIIDIIFSRTTSGISRVVSATRVGVIGTEPDQHGTSTRRQRRRSQVTELAQARARRRRAVKQLDKVVPGRKEGGRNGLNGGGSRNEIGPFREEESRSGQLSCSLTRTRRPAPGRCRRRRTESWSRRRPSRATRTRRCGGTAAGTQATRTSRSPRKPLRRSLK